MAATKMPKEKPQASVRIPKGSKVKPQGFSELGPDKEVTVVLKGTVTGWDDNSEIWDLGKSFRMNLSSCRIEGPGVKVSLNDAVKSARRKV